MYTRIRAEQIGHVGKVKVETVNGTTFARVSVASKDRYTDKRTGEVKEKTDWLEWTFFAPKTVEFIEKYAKPGQFVRIEGKVAQGSYQKGGQTIYTTEVRGFRFDFLEPKGDGASGAGDEEGPMDEEAYYR